MLEKVSIEIVMLMQMLISVYWVGTGDAGEGQHQVWLAEC
jgi:hypothetical protein